MTDRLRQESERGVQAKAVLENPVFKAAFSECHEKIRGQRLLCPITDKDQAIALVLYEKALLHIEKQLKQYIDTGKMADIQIQE